ncbi:Med5-domain-containing protein [Rhizodiscina lignyota]|uniref:Mediator of RNA polymerase II transcription subunit 5 n=1 Tax=Rhizodiscina lignyota TaxID=1504668 RepID=A0A9P4M7S2_9PEZI|nr:Med5-domain-containing protein [Rhizodiscina lignyota]
MDQNLRTWDILFKQSFERRLPGDKFSKFINQLHDRSPAPGARLAAIFFDRVSATTVPGDPRIAIYIDSLLESLLVDVSDVLKAMFLRSCARNQLAAQQHGTPKTKGRSLNSPQLESNILNQLSRLLVTGPRPKTPTEARSCLQTLVEWTAAVVTINSNESMMQAMGAEVEQHKQLESAIVRESIGQFWLAALENVKFSGLVDVGLGKNARTQISRALTAFVPLWAQLSPQSAARLESVQKNLGIIEEKSASKGSQGDGLDVAAALQIDAVMDLPEIRTRAHLYVFVSALSVSRPLTDESLILNYLNYLTAIYKANVQTLTVDLIVASFDALSGAFNRGESKFVMFTLRSFLINKIPTLIPMLASSTFEGLNTEYCITEALTHIDQAAFPTFSESFLDSSNPLSDVRQDFVFACIRHSLLPSNSTDRLLGDALMDQPPAAGSRYIKENLVGQCRSNLDLVEGYIDELEKIDGNAGAIVLAVTEMLRSLCAAKATMSLKTICNALSRKPQCLGVMLQFTSPSSILQPLCNLLDGWHYEEDQGEYQPVYEEFAAILLLVLAFINRFSLESHDIGILPSSFVAQLLVKGHISRNLDELSEDERKYLDGWILGLFNPEGISDEVMSACRPQEFYMLCPTICAQAVYACAAEVLDIKTLKSGLEYLSLPFLLPSLIGPLTWLCNHAWSHQNSDVPIVLQVFQKLVRPPSSSASDTAQAMHSTIMSIMQPKLSAVLQLIEKRDPSTHAPVESLHQTLKPFRDFHVGRVFGGKEGVPENILVGGNVEKAVRATVQGLTAWSANSSSSLAVGNVGGVNIAQPPPATYSPRVMQLASRFLTPFDLIATVIDEVKIQTEANQGHIALDVAVALICAPTANNSPVPVSWSASPLPMPPQSRSRLNLCDALKVAFEDAPSTIKKDAITAETVIRLHRRVEALCTSVSMGGDGVPGVDLAAANVDAANQMQMALDVGSAVDSMSGLLGDASGQAAQSGAGDLFDAAGMDLSDPSGVGGMDLSGAAGTSQQGAAAGQAGAGGGGSLGMEGVMPSGDDDMFADLDLGGDFTFE